MDPNHSAQTTSQRVLLTPPSGFALLKDFKSVSFKADDIFLSTLAQAQKLIENTPLAFPNNCSLQLSYGGNGQLHIRGINRPIERFEVLNPAAIRRIQYEPDRTVLTIQSDERQFTVTIHRAVAEVSEPSSYAARTTSPWRAADASSSLSRNTEGNAGRSGEG